MPGNVPKWHGKTVLKVKKRRQAKAADFAPMVKRSPIGTMPMSGLWNSEIKPIPANMSVSPM